MTDRSDDFLSRWSRRKRYATDEGDEEHSAAPTDFAREDLAGTTEPDPESDRRLLDQLGLKDPDDLLPGNEFSAFLKAAIPNHLKQRALRRLWSSNPVLANLDGLNDYDGDFTGGTVPSGGLKTAYRVGRGFLQDPAESQEPPDFATAEGLEQQQVEATRVPEIVAESVEELDPDRTESTTAEASVEVTKPDQKRRMKFRFDESS
jgi:hypothetical protein